MNATISWDYQAIKTEMTFKYV